MILWVLTHPRCTCGYFFGDSLVNFYLGPLSAALGSYPISDPNCLPVTLRPEPGNANVVEFHPGLANPLGEGVDF